jgi:hypothetical protein
MSDTLSGLFFRVRENGATVFRIDTENRHRRLDLDQLAVVNIKNGQIRVNGDRVISAEENAEISRWVEKRKATLAVRDVDDIRRTVDYLNLTAHWIQTKADDSTIDEVTDDLLLAMHDLRTELVPKKAERLAQDG